MRDKIIREIAYLLNISEERIRFLPDVETEDGGKVMTGSVKLGHFEISIGVSIDWRGNGLIEFELIPTVGIENLDEYDKNRSAWVFEIRNYEICTENARYRL